MGRMSKKQMLILFFAGILLHFWTNGASPIKGNLYPIEKDGKWGFIDGNGKIVISPRFDGAAFFPGEFGRITENNRIGFIDRTGKLIIEPQYIDAHDFSNKRVAPVLVDLSLDYGAIQQFIYRLVAPDRLGKKWGLINSTGEYVVSPRYSYCGQFTNGGLAKINLNQKEGYIKEGGEIQIQPIFNFVGEFHDGLAAAAIGGTLDWKMGYIDVNGNFQIAPEYDSVGIFSEGLAQVNVGYRVGDDAGRSGFVDRRGKLLIPLQYESTWWFSEGLAPVQKRGKWGYIDHQGRYAIPSIFDNAAPFFNGIAIVRQNGMFAGIDKKGEILFRIEADEIGNFNERILATIRIGKGIGIIDGSGNFIQRPEYDEVKFYPELIMLRMGKRLEYVNFNGKQIFLSK